MASSKKRYILLVVVALAALALLPTLHRLWLIYDPLSAFRGLPKGLVGRLVFFDPAKKTYRYLTLPEQIEGDLDISGKTVDLTFTADGRFAVYRNGFKSYLFDVATGSETKLPLPREAHFVSVPPDGRAIAYMAYREGRYALVVTDGPVRPPVARKTFVLDIQPERLCWGHDSSHIYVTTRDDTIATFDLKKGALTKMFPGRLPAPSPKGRFLAYFRPKAPGFELVFLDTATAKEHIIGKCPAIRPVVWAPDERFLLFFEPVKTMIWQAGSPAIRLRMYDVFKHEYCTVLRGRNLGLPERLLWIP